MQTVVAVQLVSAAEELAELEVATLGLREDLLILDVDDVRLARGESAPTGTRSGEVAVVGGLLLTLRKSVPLVKQVLDAVRSWLQRGTPGRTARLTIGTATIELTGVTGQQQDQLIAEFLRAVSADTAP